MPLDPIQLLGGFVAACIVLALVQVHEWLTDERRAWRYSLRSLLLVVTAAALAFGVISIALRSN